MEQENSEIKKDSSKPLPFWKVVLSVIQASFGVQKRENRERDFQQTSWVPFVVAALIFTALFVVSLVLVVRLVLS
ncbi:MAG: DUF2970 domain-containing protein [Pseudohongiellaceae bacterium]